MKIYSVKRCIMVGKSVTRYTLYEHNVNRYKKISDIVKIKFCKISFILKLKISSCASEKNTLYYVINNNFKMIGVKVLTLTYKRGNLIARSVC